MPLLNEPRILILGTGLIGSSIGLALRAVPGFNGRVSGWDPDATELATALRLGALDDALPSREAVLTLGLADIYVLASPVLPILDWMHLLAPVLGPNQLVTDVGSTKLIVAKLAATLFNGPGRAHCLPGHPMAGKESGGAALADPALFRGAAWLFTPAPSQLPEPPASHPLADQWRTWVTAFGAEVHDLDAVRHDEICAWVSHLPQFLSTALTALLADTFAADPAGRAALDVIGGRALREHTRLGASPYTMWRDIALTNTEPIAATLLALEGSLAHLRENLRTPELREEFRHANAFRAPAPAPPR